MHDKILLNDWEIIFEGPIMKFLILGFGRHLLNLWSPRQTGLEFSLGTGTSEVDFKFLNYF